MARLSGPCCPEPNNNQARAVLVSGYYGPGLRPHGYRAKWPIVAETGMETHREQGSRSRLLCQASLSGPVLRSLLSSHAIKAVFSSAKSS